jgi:general secretion pathway protein M
MIANLLFERIFLRYTGISALCYGVLVLWLLTSAVFAVSDIVQRHIMVLESTEILARYEHPKALSSRESGQVAGEVPAGSPFLEGQTETIASAALLQRVTGAIGRVGGNVVSSEVRPQDRQSTDGLVRITATCEIEQKSLQPLLYDIEAGMPFLFVNKFAAQAPVSAGDGGRMRVVLEISGLWPGTKSK